MLELIYIPAIHHMFTCTLYMYHPEILGDGSGSEESGSESSEGEESSEAEDEEGETKMEISDMTDANVLALRRTIYLTIMSR